MRLYHPATTPAPSLIRLGARLLTGIGLVALGLAALWLWLSWENTRRAAEQSMAVTAALVAAHAESQFDAIASGLTRLVADLGRAPRVDDTVWLEQFRQRYPYVLAVALRRPDGRLLAMTARAASTRPEPVPANPAWREDFTTALRERTALSVGRPYPNAVLGKWVLPLYHAVRRGGRVAYVIEVDIALSEQQSLWMDLSQVKAAAIGLLREDGYLVRAAEGRLAQELARARRDRVPFAVAIADLDGFKLVNDHYGHETGDEVLRELSAFLQAQLREGDWVARWGGEEFLVFLHQADAATATQVMERLRQHLRAHPLVTRAGTFSLTVSIGIGVWREGEELAAVLAEADGCLYETRRTGLDRVV